MSDINHQDRAHSEIGASAAKRWMACPASVGLSRGIESKSSYAAEEGTAAHELSEYCFENKVQAREAVGRTFNTNYTHDDGQVGFVVDLEMADYVQYYLDEMEKYTNEDSGYDTYIEQKFKMAKIHKDMFGSNDFCAFGIENGEMVIADFKYGAGINVTAELNLQMIIYALGAYYEFNDIYDFKKAKLIIVQPRIEGEEWDEWELSIKDLLKFEKILKAGVKKVYSKNPSIEAGDHCKFCNAKATCPEIKKQAEITTTVSFDSEPIEEATMPPVAGMTVDQIARVLDSQKMITEWMTAVKGHATEMLKNGEEVTGYKLVKGNSSRKLTSTKEFELAFDDFYELYSPRKLKGIVALEKEVGKKEIAPYFTTFEGNPIIAKESDKRKAIEVQSIDDAFSEAEETEQLTYSEMEF